MSENNLLNASNLTRASISNDETHHFNCSFHARKRHHTDPPQQCFCSQVLILNFYNVYLLDYFV
jgi:hypothetical protein